MTRSREPSADDEAIRLAEAVRAGEEGAEARLVECYGRPLRILLGRHTRDPVEAEDLFQETLRLAVEKLRGGELREADRLPAFLSSLARNLAIDHYRKLTRRRTEADSEGLERVEAPRENPLENLILREKAALVRRAIDQLGSRRDREILLRFYIAEEDRESIASDLGIDGVQFSRLLYRARQRYRTLLLERHRGLVSAGLIVWMCLACRLGPASGIPRRR